MGFPAAIVTLFSLAGAALARHAIQDASHLLFTSVSVSIWVNSFVAYILYSIFIYPHYVSPLRHLPTVPGGHWLYGHGRQIDSEHPGMPMRKW